MKYDLFIGIDPGLVNTGVVALRIYRDTCTVINIPRVIRHESNDHVKEVVDFLNTLDEIYPDSTKHIWIESYRERGTNYTTNTPMRELLARFKKALPKAIILDNTGIKKVVTDSQLTILGLKNFETTHHRDLESAARILVYGMLKNKKFNQVLYTIFYASYYLQAWTTHRK